MSAFCELSSMKNIAYWKLICNFAAQKRELGSH